MVAEILLHAAIGLLPVAGLLCALVFLDGYKLVTLRVVVAVVFAGVAVAVAAYFVNGGLLALTGLDFTTYARYIGPVVEEAGKALVVVMLIRAHRIGFLVDAAIFGFAVGTGFALVENVYYQYLVPDAGIATWIVRGLGTALMHGGATAIFAMMGIAMQERAQGAAVLLPGFALAVLLHAGFNHLLQWPRVSTLAVLCALPPTLYLVFQRSERAVGEWLGHGFDADAGLIEAISSGSFPQSHAGEYLATLRRRFKGEVVADLLCYLRLHTELALRAKGILMMRESGFDATVDDDMRAKFAEIRYLAGSIGRTGMLALHPILRRTHRDLWQLNMLESEVAAGAMQPPSSTAGT
ncbi:MAG TPA: PrsW family glutamic-type intramembrane protease [Casimicrobiaceae bacterium]|jgi:RsiW-degrading membrane proteinase PrsW (M82 family)|nr:PrsW family glutamic-type intramembrane protease [Casimicrobiaceae bacterium]